MPLGRPVLPLVWPMKASASGSHASTCGTSGASAPSGRSTSRTRVTGIPLASASSAARSAPSASAKTVTVPVSRRIWIWWSSGRTVARVPGFVVRR